MTRKEERVSLKLRTNGTLYICRSKTGEILIYEDQFHYINEKISSCRTRDEAREIIHDFSRGLDLHHSDVHIAKKKSRTVTSTKKTQIKISTVSEIL